jgi:hypothetical protein
VNSPGTFVPWPWGGATTPSLISLPARNNPAGGYENERTQDKRTEDGCQGGGPSAETGGLSETPKVRLLGLELNEFFFLLATGKAVVQIIPVEAVYAVVASANRGLMVLRCCQMQDSRLSGHVPDARSGRGPASQTAGWQSMRVVQALPLECATFRLGRPRSGTCGCTSRKAAGRTPGDPENRRFQH